MKTVILIPARGGSKRVPRKNIKKLCGRPLIDYVIKASLASMADEVWVSTEDEEIERVAFRSGARIILRPVNLARDDTPTEAVMEHFVKHVDCDILVLIEPTHPLIITDDINRALKKFERDDYDSLVTLENKKLFVWDVCGDIAFPANFNYKHRPRMQDFGGFLVETVGIWITSVEQFKKTKLRISGKIGWHCINRPLVDIDTLIDFKIAEVLLNEQRLHQKLAKQTQE